MLASVKLRSFLPPALIALLLGLAALAQASGGKGPAGGYNPADPNCPTGTCFFVAHGGPRQPTP